MFSHQSNSITNDLADGPDGNGLKFEKIGQFFSSFDATC